VGFIITYALDAQGNIHRLQGALVEAKQQLVEALEHAQDHQSAYEMGLCHTSLGTLAGEERDLASARLHLDQAIERFEAGGFTRDLARACIQRAQIGYLARDPRTALMDLERALAVGAQLGYDQFLVVDGQHLQPLLRYAADQGVGAEVLPGLLARIGAHEAMQHEQPEPVLQSKTPPALAIYALGKPRVEQDRQSVQWAIAQSRDLFFCLLQHPRGLRKEEIGRIFWPDHSPPKMDGIFRSTLYRLRRSVFRESIIFEEGSYQFNRESDYWFDAEAFEELLNQAEQSPIPERKQVLLEQALALYRGDYLEGIYEDWCALERERLKARHLAALELLAGLYADRRELQPAIGLYQRLLEQDPYQEAAHRELMRCYYRMGDRAAAIRQYQVCTEILREDLGLSPAPETEALYLRVIG
jgi:DNA-binding SARP family transcriptional activator